MANADGGNQEQEIEQEGEKPLVVPAADEPEGVSKVTWQEIDRIYNLSSEFTDIQKEEYWKGYKGKRVQWSGTVTDISDSFRGDLTLAH